MISSKSNELSVQSFLDPIPGGLDDHECAPSGGRDGVNF